MSNNSAAETAVYAAFDVETTGLIPGVDRIVEIGAVSFRLDGILEVFNALVDPGMPMPDEARRVNGISDEMLEGKPGIGDILPDFLRFLGPSYPVAHNAAFDVGFLSVDIERLGLPAPGTPVFDTRSMAMLAFPGRSRYGLDALRREHHLGKEGAHRALADAQACRKLFLLCVERLARGGVTSIDGLLKLSGGPLSLTCHRPPDVARIALLARAIERGETVEITYMSSHGSRTVRKITPRSFRVIGGSPAIEAFCHLRGEERSFLISSIERLIGAQ